MQERIIYSLKPFRARAERRCKYVSRAMRERIVMGGGCVERGEIGQVPCKAPLDRCRGRGWVMKKCTAGIGHVPGPLGQPIRGGFIHAVGFVRSRDVRKGFPIRRDGVQTLRMLFRVAARTRGVLGTGEQRFRTIVRESQRPPVSARGEPCPVRYSPGSSASREATGACA